MAPKEFALDSNQALTADTDTPDLAPSFDSVALDLIVASEWNRKTFDPVKLQELADSIRSQGVSTPILLRPLPGQRLADLALVSDASHTVFADWPHKQQRPPRPTYEIVAGERRWRASVMAEKRTIPAVIRPMTDQEVLETQLVENLQREDLHPLDEAEGYQRLCETTGLKKEEIGAKIGKSRSYVYQRLHLLELGQEARAAFRAGKVDASKALLLAGVADPKLQLKALKEVSEERYGGRTMSVREFRDWLEQNVMLKLDHAPFDIKDAFLFVPCPAPQFEGTRACTECPKRTGANPDIFAAFDSPDMCTDAKCYGQKASVTLQRIKDAAAEKGMKVIAGVEAKKLKPYNYGDQIKGYTRLDEKLEGGSVAKLLGEAAPAATIFVDPHTHKQIKVLPTEIVGELLKDKGVKLAQAAATDHAAQREKDEVKRQAKAAFETAWRARVASAIDAQVRQGVVTSFSPAVLRLICTLLLDSMDSDNTDALLPLWGLPTSGEQAGWQARRENNEALKRHVQAAGDLDLGRMVLHLVIAEELDGNRFTCGDSATGTAAIEILAGETGVDVAGIQREVKAQMKAAAKAAAAPAGAKSKAAQADTVAPDGGKAAAKKPAARGRKVSTEEAKSGIADAMQNIEPDSVNDFAVGQRVRFKMDLKGHDGKLRKVCGREGTIRSKVGDRAWSVMHGTRAHERANADYTELEHVEAAAADGEVASGALELASGVVLDPMPAWPFPPKGARS